jgi:hypothetical protein
MGPVSLGAANDVPWQRGHRPPVTAVLNRGSDG